MDEFSDALIKFLKGDGITIANTVSVFIFGLLAVKLVLLFANKIAVRTKVEKTISSFTLSILSVGLYFALILATGKVAGVSTASLVALLSAAGLAISLALKDSLSNLANGFIILGSKPFVVGDYVEVSGVEGNVKSIGFFNTKLVTVDNKIITLPNSSLIGNNVVNHSTNPTRRLDININLPHNADVKVAGDALISLAKTYNEVLTEPEPIVYVTGFSETSQLVSFRVWLPTESYWDVKFDINSKIVGTLKDVGIELSVNKMDVKIDNGGLK